jgi:cytochrome P450
MPADAPRLFFHPVTITDYALFKYPDYTLPLSVKMAEVSLAHNLDVLHVHYAVPHATAAILARSMLPPDRQPRVVTTLHGTDTTLLGRDAGYDLLSLLQRNEKTHDMIDRPHELLGNLLLLIVGGNDTTRNSLTGGVLALNQNPGEYAKLRADPALIPSMVSEIIRWQTPLAHMRRLAKEDTDFGGKRIRKGDKMVMWYISGNRDDQVIERADEFIIDRPKARHHLSFGFGIHRCMGNRLAEMQLRIVWEELVKRFRHVEVVGEPVRIRSNFVRGYESLPVRLHPN